LAALDPKNMPKPNRALPWTIFLLILAVYLAFLTKNYYWDGVVFAYVIEHAKSAPMLLHPNHLLYNGVGYLFFKASGVLGSAMRALTVLQIANCLFSVLTAAVVFRILKESFGSLYIATVLTLLFGFSATWWRFSTDADAYIPSIFFMTCAFCLVLPGRKPRPLAVALLHVCAIVLHQLAVLFCPVLALGLFMQNSCEAPKSSVTRSIKRPVEQVALYLSLTFLLVFGAYCYCFHAAFGPLHARSFFRWITYYTSDAGGFTFNARRNLGDTISGNVRLFFGGRLNYMLGALNPAVIAIAVLLAACILVLGIRLLMYREELLSVWRGIWQRARPWRPIGLLCMVWCSIYLIFLFFFIPQNAFYKLFYFPALIFMMGIVLAGAQASPGYRRRWRAGLAVAAVIAGNFLFFTLPYSRVREDTPLSLALEMNKVWPAGTVIYFYNMNTDDYLISYFNPATEWMPMNPGKLGKLDAQLQAVRDSGSTAWLETTAIDAVATQPGGAAWLAAHSEDRGQYALHTAKYDVELLLIFPASEPHGLRPDKLSTPSTVAQ
jgi:hypothetical protein